MSVARLTRLHRMDLLQNPEMLKRFSFPGFGSYKAIMTVTHYPYFSHNSVENHPYDELSFQGRYIAMINAVEDE